MLLPGGIERVVPYLHSAPAGEARGPDIGDIIVAQNLFCGLAVCCLVHVYLKFVRRNVRAMAEKEKRRMVPATCSTRFLDSIQEDPKF